MPPKSAAAVKRAQNAQKARNTRESILKIDEIISRKRSKREASETAFALIRSQYTIGAGGGTKHSKSNYLISQLCSATEVIADLSREDDEELENDFTFNELVISDLNGRDPGELERNAGIESEQEAFTAEIMEWREITSIHDLMNAIQIDKAEIPEESMSVKKSLD